MIDIIKGFICGSEIAEIDQLNKNNKDLRDILTKKNTTSAEENYWNLKWPKTIIRYKSQGKVYRDVRTLINYPSYLADEIVKTKRLKKDTEDKTILAILKWIVTNYHYRFDINNPVFGGKFAEFWMDSDIAIQMKYRDCEDNAILLKALSLAAGVPDYKVHVIAGWVKDPSNPKGKVGHAYPTYIFEGKEYIVDPTYYPDYRTTFDKRKTLQEDPRYNPIKNSIWWCFTKDFCFGRKQVTL